MFSEVSEMGAGLRELGDELRRAWASEVDFLKPLFHDHKAVSRELVPSRILQLLGEYNLIAGGEFVRSKVRISSINGMFIVSDHADYAGDETVAGSVMSPYPENITLLRSIEGMGSGSVLEIGSGSGINLVALAKTRRCPLVALEVNPRAVFFCFLNFLLNGLDSRDLAVILHGRTEAPGLFFSVHQKFEYIIANPPFEYGRAYEGETLRRYGSAGPRGLDFIEVILTESYRYLVDGGELRMVFFSPGGFSGPDAVVELVSGQEWGRFDVLFAGNPISTHEFVKEVVGSALVEIPESDRWYWHGIVTAKAGLAGVSIVEGPPIADWHLPL